MSSIVKDFILTAPIEEGRQQVVKKANKPSVTYEVIFASGTDFAVRRKTARTSQVLAVIVSQNQFYTKDETGGGIIEALNVDRLKKFTSSLNEDGLKLVDSEGNSPSWVGTMRKGTDWAECFMNIVRSADAQPYLKYGMFWMEHLAVVDFNWKSFNWIPRSKFEEVKVVFDTILETMPRHAACMALMFRENRYVVRERDFQGVKASSVLLQIFVWYNYKDSTTAYDEIKKRWGVEGVRTFVRAFMTSPVIMFPSADTFRILFERNNLLTYNRWNNPEEENLPATEFALQNMVDYMFFSCAEQGYAEDPGGFWNLWDDYLDAQHTLFGKINEKYSETLASAEKILAYRVSMLRKAADEELWGKAVEKMKQYEWKSAKYSIICPKTQDDLIDEGRQMAHCVGNYGNSVANGVCMIFFLRETENINHSLVTIEVRGDGSLGQVRARFNRAPKAEQMDVVQKWYHKMFEQNQEPEQIPEAV